MRRRSEHGGVAVLIAVMVPAIVAIGVGLVLVGNVTTLRQRLQYATDAVAADGALVAKRQGLASPTQPNVQSGAYAWLPSAAATQAAFARSRDGNLPLGGTQPYPSWTMQRLADGSDWAMSASALQMPYAGLIIRAQAQYRMRQLRSISPHRRPPGVILVLDYSNSMNKQGSGGTAIQLLRNAVVQFLNGLTPDFVNLGLVIYGSNVYATVQPELSSASGNFANIRNQINEGASGDTDTADAINTATQMLTALPENFGRNIILISDGEPCCSGNATNAAIAAATSAKSGALVQIYTLSVHHAGTTGNPDATLASIASPGAAFTVAAVGIADLLQQFSAQPLCDLTPGGDPNDAYAFLRNEGAGQEQPLLRYATTADMTCPGQSPPCRTYGYVDQTSPFPRVIFSSQACSDVFSGQRSAVARWGLPVLAK